MRFLLPLLPALGFMALAHAFDYVSFLMMMAQHGLAAELNPLVVILAQSVGLPGLTVAKLAVVVMASAAVVLIGRRRRRVAIAVMTLGSLAGFVGGMSNVATIAAF